MPAVRRGGDPDPPRVPRNFAISDAAESGPPTWWLGVCEGKTVIVKLEHWQLEGLSGFEMVFFTSYDDTSATLPPRIADLNGFDFARAVARGEFQRLELKPAHIGGEGHA